jgi:hypothetical protein
MQPAHIDLEIYKGSVIHEPVNGKFKITIPASTSSAYAFTSAVYDLEIVFTDQTVVRVIEGSLIAIPEVTR